jgi:hypothetical protein
MNKACHNQKKFIKYMYKSTFKLNYLELYNPLNMFWYYLSEKFNSLHEIYNHRIHSCTQRNNIKIQTMYFGIEKNPSTQQKVIYCYTRQIFLYLFCTHNRMASLKCILKFLKSYEGEKGINRITFLEKHFKIF